MLQAARRAFPGVPWVATPPADPVEVGTAPLPGGVLAPGAHPLPDEGSVQAAELALKRVRELGPHELVLLLVSGGGSSLWCAPHRVSLSEKRAVVNDLMLAGADIFELNTVRKHLSRVKGGKLAAATRAGLLVLVISDVPGDDVSMVASGPAAPDATTPADALRVLDRFGLEHPAVRRALSEAADDPALAATRPGSPVWERVHSVIVGSNRALLEAARGWWEERGVRAVVLGHEFTGDVQEVARQHAAAVRYVLAGGDARALEDASPAELLNLTMADPTARPAANAPAVLLSGGEATVNVTGGGRGGRNQEFALWLLRFLREDAAAVPVGNGWEVWALSAGSDGIDGNSDAAGAFLTPTSLARAASAQLDVDAFLAANDSHGFFAPLGDALVTGLTGNNLNDYRAVLLKPLL